MTREHDLITELRAARIKLSAAIRAEQDAKAVVYERKADRMRAAALVEEILGEIETGKTDRPILDQIAQVRACPPLDPPAEETADERQRGTTAVPTAPAKKTRAKMGPAQPAAQVPYWRSWLLKRRLAIGGSVQRKLRDSILAELKDLEIETWGQLHDYLDANNWTVGDLGLTAAEVDYLTAELVEWRSDFDWKDDEGFPARLLGDASELADGEPDQAVEEMPDGGSVDDRDDGPPPTEWVSGDLDAGLRYACTKTATHMRIEPDPWAAFRKLGGITDRQILEVLRSIWPGVPSCRTGPKCLPRITVLGGSAPMFWVDHHTPRERRPTLEGHALADRVRRVLELPRFVAGSEAVPIPAEDLAETASKAKPAKKSKPKEVANAS